jgi:hypothetical protein
MTESAVLVKFGQQEHLQQLQDDGLLYMNNLPYFWQIEDEELRGDPYDSVDEVARGRNSKITLPNGREVPFQGTSWVIRIRPPEAERINIFCMYALRPSTGSFPVDSRNYKFGDSALVVTQPQEFIDRVGASLRTDRINGRGDLVEYVDEQYAGEIGPFRKLRQFTYQSEWRLVCYDGPGEVRKIMIGGIRNISIVMPSREINKIVTIGS